MQNERKADLIEECKACVRETARHSTGRFAPADELL
jgi:hypothetical protein